MKHQHIINLYPPTNIQAFVNPQFLLLLFLPPLLLLLLLLLILLLLPLLLLLLLPLILFLLLPLLILILCVLRMPLHSFVVVLNITASIGYLAICGRK